jgi:ubiquinone/menaquinone biosynthesis C-methylase UbiE
MDYLYKKFAKYYDLCYSGKDYVKETKFLEALIKKHKIKGKKILEVGSGTGNHAVCLEKKGFDIIGVDLNEEMLAVARKKSKKIKFVQGDMRSFNIKDEFDIILCLFSTMHYNTNVSDLKKTLKNFYKHLKKGGLLIFDMGFNEERYSAKQVHAHTGSWSRGDVELVRFMKSRQG